MSNDYKLVPHDEIIAIPPEVATCPYCGAKLWVQLDTWTQLDDGTWKAMEDETPNVECGNEPDVLSKEWDDWYFSHSKDTYVYQLPVDVKVSKWLNENYRFDMGKQSR